MKTIGILGGMSWESTADYYRFLNKGINAKLGKLHSAKILLHSFDFNDIEELQRHNKWEELSVMLLKEALTLETSGADFILIATNTMHKLVEKIETKLTIPVLHIADVTGQEILKNGVKKVALFGTRFTMEEDFYKGRIQSNFGIEVVTPNNSEMNEIHRIIYTELCLGIIKKESKDTLVKIIKRLKTHENIEGVILGCTELPLIIKPEDTDVTIYNTTEIHCKYAIEESTK